jgi:hypothetical protein
MKLHEIIKVKGCITQERYIKGKKLAELERILGFQKGRLDQGVTIVVLIQLPDINQFELSGYSQVAGHKFNDESVKGLDVTKLKQNVLKDNFTLAGPKRLVKVIPDTPHNDILDNDTQYPPGLGVPQWKLTGKVSARVVAKLKSQEVYQ